MASAQTPRTKESRTRRSPKIVVGFGIVIVLTALVLFLSNAFEEGGVPARGLPTFVTQRGPLTISVIESGTIKARDQIIIKNAVEGKTVIIRLVSEGTMVKKGDLLVELDASSLEDAKIDQEIRVQNAEAAYVSAKENLAVIRNQAESDMDKARLTLEFAEQDLEHYKKGKFPNALSAAENRITLAQEELTRARETLKWSQKLCDEKYISQTELQADELTAKRKALDLELAKNDLELLRNFTYHREIAQLESDVAQAKMAFERTTRKAKADVVQAEANLTAKNAEYKRQEDKLAKIHGQIAKTRIYAPADGLVIYATSAKSGGWRGNVEPLNEGQEVRERQELIYLPTTTSAMAEVEVHEANLKKVTQGLPAVISVDALPGETFAGRVAHIAPLPDAQSMWMNPDLKIYNTTIYLDGSDPKLRAGMSCRAEIIFEQYDSALYVPVQAVLRVKGEPTVYVVDGDRIVPRKVQIGLDNSRMIRIVSGIEQGDEVLLTPPLEAGATADSGRKAEKGALNARPGERGQAMKDQTTSGKDIVRLVDARKIYKRGTQEVHALASVTMSFVRGSFWAVMGPSGSGKSTLMNILGCLDRLTSGSYYLEGRDVSRMRDDELSEIRLTLLGFVFQSFNLIPQFTVQRNIELPLHYLGWEAHKSAERAVALAEEVGLAERLDHRPAELSGGQMQRVAIARALANDPHVIFADEPTGNLDTKTGNQILDLLTRLNAQGKTIIMVTHEPAIAERAAHQLHMIDGVIDQEKSELP